MADEGRPTCNAKLEGGDVCGRLATTVFGIGPDATVPRCELHTAVLRTSLQSLLRQDSWIEWPLANAASRKHAH
jgi:hypothetical protein